MPLNQVLAFVLVLKLRAKTLASRQTKTLDSSALETRDVGIEIKRLFRADSRDIAVYQVSLLRNAAKN